MQAVDDQGTSFLVVRNESCDSVPRIVARSAAANVAYTAPDLPSDGTKQSGLRFETAEYCLSGNACRFRDLLEADVVEGPCGEGGCKRVDDALRGRLRGERPSSEPIRSPFSA